MYRALYRKWRPRTFDEVVGQKHITDTLKTQVANGRTSHAYLFTGSRGTGKTTCAKILAKAVNCQHPVDGNPCNQCPTCLGIENGSILDVVELDAASNNSVDNVRALRDEAIYTPASGKMRVYIIDEVHMLSNAAFNALLKIMEEPPAHLLFILATTEVHKIPATILSRCQRFSFKRLLPEDIAAHLTRIAIREDIDLRTDAAALLARLSDGAARDALSLLDQCAASGRTVDTALVCEMLGLAGGDTIRRLLDLIVRRDSAGVLNLFSEIYQSGRDAAAVLDELSTLLRDLLIVRTAPEGGAALLSGASDTGSLRDLAQQFTPARLLYMLKTISATQAGLSASLNRRIDCELCLLSLCDESLSTAPEALTARLDRLESGGFFAAPAPKPEAGAAPAPAPGDCVPAAAPEPAPAEPATGTEPAGGTEPAAGQVYELWPDVVQKLKRVLNPSETACLANQKLVRPTLSGSVLTLTYEDSVTGMCINKPSVREAIANCMGGITVLIRNAEARPPENERFSPLEKLGDHFDNVTYI